MQHQLLIEIVDRAADFIAMADADGRVTYLNPSARAMIGMPPRHDLGSTRLSDFHPAWVGDLLVGTGLPEARRTGSWSAETALLHRNGREFPVSQTIVAHRDAEGRLQGYSTIARDISDRRAHEIERQKLFEALRRSEAQFKRAQAIAQVGSYELAIPSSGDDYWSEEVSRILGLDPLQRVLDAEDLIGRFVHPEDRPDAEAAYAQAIGEGKPYSLEVRIVRPDGTVRWVHSLGGLVRRDDGPVPKLVGTLQDITERKHTEKALHNLAGQLIKAQEEERSRIGRELHDHISQRLGVVSIKLDQLRQESPARVSGIQRSLENVLKHVDEITGEIHRLSHRLHSATLHDLGLVPAIQRLADDFREHHHLEVECTFSSIPSMLPPAVSLCLFRIVEEGLNNVAKHSGAASAQVHLARNADGIHLMIADTGVGFDPRAIEEQAGLGFVSMRERCRLVQANVLVHSSPSRGTTIGIWVPSRSLDWNSVEEDEPADGAPIGLTRDGG
jgi:PAS domain S-box-containing protein